MKSVFKKAQLKCAFWEWMPKNQRVFAVDFGETEETREETIEWMWRRFVEVLLSVAERP